MVTFTEDAGAEETLTPVEVDVDDATADVGAVAWDTFDVLQAPRSIAATAALVLVFANLNLDIRLLIFVGLSVIEGVSAGNPSLGDGAIESGRQ